jgi:hypothetical protein
MGFKSAVKNTVIVATAAGIIYGNALFAQQKPKIDTIYKQKAWILSKTPLNKDDEKLQATIKLKMNCNCVKPATLEVFNEWMSLKWKMQKDPEYAKIGNVELLMDGIFTQAVVAGVAYDVYRKRCTEEQGVARAIALLKKISRMDKQFVDDVAELDLNGESFSPSSRMLNGLHAMVMSLRQSKIKYGQTENAARGLEKDSIDCDFLTYFAIQTQNRLTVNKYVDFHTILMTNDNEIDGHAIMEMTTKGGERMFFDPTGVVECNAGKTRVAISESSVQEDMVDKKTKKELKKNGISISDIKIVEAEEIELPDDVEQRELVCLATSMFDKSKFALVYGELFENFTELDKNRMRLTIITQLLNSDRKPKK